MQFTAAARTMPVNTTFVDVASATLLRYLNATLKVGGAE